eukprot:3354825-Pyramimonas_sp.AAC.1
MGALPSARAGGAVRWAGGVAPEYRRANGGAHARIPRGAFEDRRARAAAVQAPLAPRERSVGADPHGPRLGAAAAQPHR